MYLEKRVLRKRYEWTCNSAISFNQTSNHDAFWWRHDHIGPWFFFRPPHFALCIFWPLSAGPSLRAWAFLRPLMFPWDVGSPLSAGPSLRAWAFGARTNAHASAGPRPTRPPGLGHAGAKDQQWWEIRWAMLEHKVNIKHTRIACSVIQQGCCIRVFDQEKVSLLSW